MGPRGDRDPTGRGPGQVAAELSLRPPKAVKPQQWFGPCPPPNPSQAISPGSTAAHPRPRPQLQSVTLWSAQCRIGGVPRSRRLRQAWLWASCCLDSEIWDLELFFPLAHVGPHVTSAR